MSLSAPSKIIVPFGQSGNRNIISVTTATGDATNKATWTYGFPQVTMTAKSAGGIPPFGRDMNGVLYSISSMLQYLQAGGTYTFDAAFAASVSGYGKGALLQQEDLSGFWVSQADNNTSNPETDGENWQPLDAGTYSFSISTANVTLTNAQAAHPILIVSGTLTGSRTIVVPKFKQQWIVINNVTRGSYTLSIKTANGTGVSLKKAVEQVVCDGTNVYKVGGEETAQVPIGCKIDWYSPNIPEGYLVANGQAVSRILYPELFAVYGTYYGAGDGVNTFNLPNLMSYFGRYGTADQVGTTVAASIESHTHGVTQESHTHGITDPGHAHAVSMEGAGEHAHGRGTMEIYGEFATSRADDHYTGVFARIASGKFSNRQDASDGHYVSFKASKNWTGLTSNAGGHIHNAGASSARTGIALNGATANITIDAYGGTETAPKHIYEIPIIRAV